VCGDVQHVVLVDLHLDFDVLGVAQVLELLAPSMQFLGQIDLEFIEQLVALLMELLHGGVTGHVVNYDLEQVSEFK